jgi:hypothetical protein
MVRVVRLQKLKMESVTKCLAANGGNQASGQFNLSVSVKGYRVTEFHAEHKYVTKRSKNTLSLYVYCLFWKFCNSVTVLESKGA